jgi:cytochrome c oxidase subunit 4
MAAHGAEDIQKHVRVYMVVFASLAGLTLVTVAISYLHLPVAQAVALALVVASVKASLVALYFMHLIAEEKTIYWLLGLTSIFFIAVMYLPITWGETRVVVDSVWDTLPIEGSAAHVHGAEDGHH